MHLHDIHYEMAMCRMYGHTNTPHKTTNMPENLKLCLTFHVITINLVQFDIDAIPPESAIMSQTMPS